MRGRGLCLLLLLPAAQRAHAAPEATERERLVAAVREFVTAGKVDEAVKLLKEGRAAAPDDLLAAGLCLLAERPEDARAEIRRAMDRGPADPFDIGAELAGVAGPASAKAALEREDAQRLLHEMFGEDGCAQALLGVGGRRICNSIGMELVRIRPGKFLVRDKRLFGTREREVTLTRPFFLGATEVTQAQWKAVMGGNPSRFQGDDLPVENVSWDDAVRFCEKLSEKEMKEYRLPTEAEWEYACRAGAPVFTPYGPLSKVAWTGQNCFSWRDLRESERPVGRKRPNDWGLHDMLGNVLEWCADGFDHFPAALVDPVGKARGRKDPHRVLRGGSWCYRASKYFAPDFRFDAAQSIRSEDIGFRVARAP